MTDKALDVKFSNVLNADLFKPSCNNNLFLWVVPGYLPHIRHRPVCIHLVHEIHERHERNHRTILSTAAFGWHPKFTSSPTLANRHRKLMRQSFYLVAVSTINARLREQKVQPPVTTGTLVLVKEGLIKQAMNKSAISGSSAAAKSTSAPMPMPKARATVGRSGFTRGLAAAHQLKRLWVQFL